MTYIHQYPIDLQQKIESDIASGKLKPAAIFTIAKLGRRYGGDVLSAATILPALVRKGLVEKVGQKTYTICGLPKAKIESVFQYAQKSKLKPTTIVRDVSIIQANEFLAEKLSVDVGAPVFQQVRTRLVDGNILANQYNFIPYEICPGLEKIDLSKRSFQVTLKEDFHTVITRIEETYSLSKPKRDDAEILDLTNDDRVLIVERMSYSSNELPLVFADIHVNPKEFHYVASLWPEADHIVKGYKK